MSLFYIVPLLIGILGTDVCYLTREKDLESRKLYIVTLIVGLIILASVLLRLFL